MEAIEFPQQTFILAKDQPQYIPLPVHVKYYLNEQGEPKFNTPVAEEMTCCFKLSAEEIAEINATGRLWHTQCVFGNPFQPIRMTTQNPFGETLTQEQQDLADLFKYIPHFGKQVETVDGPGILRNFYYAESAGEINGLVVEMPREGLVELTVYNFPQVKIAG